MVGLNPGNPDLRQGGRFATTLALLAFRFLCPYTSSTTSDASCTFHNGARNATKYPFQTLDS
jgi:hypothetical protein